MIEGQKTIIDTLLTAFKKTDERANKYEEQLQLKEDEIGLVKPKWWQHPIAIVCYIVGSFVTGIFVAL